MRKVITAVAVGSVLLFGHTLLGDPAHSQQNGATQSIRGVAELDETNSAPDVKQLDTGRRFEKAYRQQPPMIPHKIDKYQIDRKANQCMRCHDWPYNARENAPKISETHYTDRNGVALDQLARTRWFCTQCHVTQTDAPALVPSTFQPAAGRR